MSDKKIVDETHQIAKRRGNGQLRREIWANRVGTISRYNLAYINHHLSQGDNGRVVGYDNAHGFHHRHYLGGIETVDFVSFEQIEDCFQKDWTSLRRS
ncbi:toxin-antitoxin system TumE family protein [Yersinia intermedia]|uniref:toxin-antitoxin system TumE family protein n=1 Tax=Yersinia intermedia TaxID=631 RepID=UPI0005E07826|nr:DUF6516 family protein [Yersinia intermedia]MCB5297317.1 DUF6516 family protein [Yersinia intermedia]CNK26096.1 Uncharacterised protein [Yersinia intermedia]